MKKETTKKLFFEKKEKHIFFIYHILFTILEVLLPCKMAWRELEV